MRSRAESSSAAIPAWLRRVCHLLREAQREEPHRDDRAGAGIAWYANQVGKHPVHLAREFRRHFGQTAGEYQRRLRLERAEQLLRNPAMPLADIALKSGFCSQSHLSRSFKSAYSMTPSGVPGGSILERTAMSDRAQSCFPVVLPGSA
jgi:AraC family transcriptional regulator